MQFAGLNVTSAPANLALSLSDAKDWLRVDHTDEDTLITAVVKAATSFVESWLKMALITQTVQVTYDTLHYGNWLHLPKSPLQSVTTVETRDGDGNYSTVAASTYSVDTNSTPGRIRWITRPDYDTEYGEAIRVTFVAGFGADSADIPADIVHCVRLMTAHLYERREVTHDAGSISEVPISLRAFLDSQKLAAL